MTPLELLAVGVIVVLVWWAGMWSGGRYERGESPDFMAAPAWIGIAAIVAAGCWLIILGIKESR